MKLNYDCLRMVLTEIENFQSIDENLKYQDMTLDDMIKAIPDFSKNDIAYVTLKAKEAGLIHANIMNADGRIYACIYTSLTYDGHQFLDNVRNDNIWAKTKSIAKEIGCTSLKSLISISEKVISTIIQTQL